MEEQESLLAKDFIENLNLAREIGLEHEFIYFVLRELKVTRDQLYKAINYARDEWDF
jgi:hypothetical protein